MSGYVEAVEDMMQTLRDRSAAYERLTSENAALRARVAELEGVGRDVATRMHRQVKASDGYAESAAKKDELRPTVWQICNSHFTDLARELEAALRAKAAGRRR